jgi:DGQHR domain-containing protein
MINFPEKALPDIEGYREESFPCLKVVQPIGDFFIASIDSHLLCEITFFDVRRIMKEERDFEGYLGIQRPVEKKRVKDLQKYVTNEDACFPTAIILSIPGECARFDEQNNTMVVSNITDVAEGESPIYLRQIAKVIDGQHRIEGLRNYQGKPFQLNVSIFVDIDTATQAQIFGTVNLEQTKVNKSLVYDLFALATHRSPQKTCHNIAVALDKNDGSPFLERIKRLGVTTANRYNETITQATFVEALLKYISADPKHDRNLYLKNQTPSLLGRDLLQQYIFANMFIEEKDLEITDVLWNFFSAVNERWPKAWGYQGTGLMLNKTNGFKALMRYLPKIYLKLGKPGDVPSKEDFLTALKRISIENDEFTTDTFKPGTGGESRLFRSFINGSIVE